MTQPPQDGPIHSAPTPGVPMPRPWFQWRWPQQNAAVPEVSERLEFRSKQQRQLASMSVAIWWLSFLATLWAFVVAKALVVPILFAAFVALSLNPIVYRLSRWLPRSLVAALVVLFGIGLLVLLVMWVAEPAQHWFERAPGAVRSLAPKLRAMTQQLEAAGRATQSIITLGGSTTAKPDGSPTTPALFDIWDALAATPRLLTSMFAVVLLSYFFLVYGDALLQKTVSLAPSLEHKRSAVDIIRTMQSEMSHYLFTTALINTCVGIGAGLIAYFFHLEDPLFWAVLAAIINFIPYIGPFTMTLVFVILGLLQFDKMGHAIIPALCFGGLVILEGQFLTPLILGRRLKLNPVAILIWLMLMGWLWGAVGVVLAVPSLVVIKIVCERVHGWDWVARAVE